MTLSQIYTEISSHLVKGLMVHSQLQEYFLFLGMEGYSKMHQYHYMDESRNYLKLCQYYTKHHNGMIEDKRIDDPAIVPKDWYQKERAQIEPKSIPNLIAKGADEWVKWERSTKELLQHKYKELINIGEIASAEFIAEFIKDVDEELSYATSEQLILDSVNYDMSYIADDQLNKLKRFEEKKWKFEV